MVNYREILRLKSLKYSQREIALSVRSSRNTVKEVVDLATALKIEWPLDPDVTNQDLESVCNLRRTAATGAFASGHPAEPNGHLH